MLIEIDKLTIESIKLAISSFPKEHAVDIGCSYNSFLLQLGIKRNLFIEYDNEKLIQIPLGKEDMTKNIRIDSSNVFGVFDEFRLPEDFTFLNLDIDSFDFVLLKKILTKYRPMVICSEINEKIPPPIKFFIDDEKHSWWDSKCSHLYGYSISCLSDIQGYDIAGLIFNNVILIRSDMNEHDKLTPTQAYKEGYIPFVNREDSKSYNYDMFPLLDMQPEEAIKFIDEKFSGNTGVYKIGL